MVEVIGNRHHLTDKKPFPVRSARLSATSFIFISQNGKTIIQFEDAHYIRNEWFFFYITKDE
ncbi:hypothetical protein B1B05_10960 [Domibacillus enclensis]|uniref:Uncharacterized protein n=1 Tax=Domibacillus enclensis TaxID=1017273 RepID=A0ABX4E8U9_9BACI|nr:hypothetical protein B1B05_10960 [Domibacillus enclensis]